MNRLILGIVLLLTAIWLARADDKSAAGPEKITPTRAKGVALKFVPAESLPGRVPDGQFDQFRPKSSGARN